MALIIICVTKDDIKTTRTGLNFTIQCTNPDLQINFTAEALDALIKDYKQLKKRVIQKHKAL